MLLVALVHASAFDPYANRSSQSDSEWTVSPNFGIGLALFGIVIALCIGVMLTNRGRSPPRTRRRRPPTSHR